jgi:hypothetical protein
MNNKEQKIGDFKVEKVTKFKKVSIPIRWEIKKNNQFVVEFDDTEIQHFVVKNVKRPAYNVSTNTWGDIEFELNDLVGPSTLQMVFSGIINNKNHKNKPSKITINMFDPVGEIIESWILEGRYINIEFSDFDYSNNEDSTIKIKFKIISCKLMN